MRYLKEEKMGKVAIWVFVGANLAFANQVSLATTSIQQKIIATAEQMIGGKYEHGGYNPENRAFDCWGFVTWVYRTAFQELATEGAAVPLITFVNDMFWVYFDDINALEVGDILMNNGPHGGSFHAAIYYGKEKTIEARAGTGINVFSIKGHNPYAPFGQTGLRFSHFSLKARLWRNPKPPHPYVYVETPESLYFAEKNMDLIVHGYVPKGHKGVHEIKVSLLNALDQEEVLRSLAIVLVDMIPGEEVIHKVTIPTAGLGGSYVYIAVELRAGDQVVARYDTLALAATRIF